MTRDTDGTADTPDDADPWTTPTTALFDRVRRRLAAGDPTVVVTVVDVVGSAYRRPGAKTALTARGDPLEAVADGREDPLADVARRAHAAGRPLVETVELSADDEAWGFGLGWNGVVTLLVETADETWTAALTALADGETCVAATVVATDHPACDVGDRLLFDADADSDATPLASRSTTEPTRLTDAVKPHVDGLPPGASRVVSLSLDGDAVDVFLDSLTPPPEMLVFGGQGDVRPVASLAHDVGFRVTVAAPREADALAVPSAHRVVAVRPAELADAVETPALTYAVLMSHDFAADRDALASLLETAVPYLGLLGPRERFAELRKSLTGDGTVDDAAFERVASPVGLDVGASDPSQVALSVIAEALAVANGRDGGRLCHSTEPIHPR